MKDQRAVQKADGSWTVDGMGAEVLIPTVRLWEDMFAPLNSSFYVSAEPQGCIEHIENNLSDTSSLLVPIRTESSHFTVRDVIAASRVEFISGYSILEEEIDGKETATVFSNLDLLEGEVYGWYLVLVTTFFVFINLKIALFSPLRDEFNPLKSPMKFIDAVRHELSAVFYNESDEFKWITMLYSLSCFYVITSFLILYKTSHVVVKKPGIAQSYEDTIRIKSSVAIYYDQFAESSSSFRDAPRDSVKGEMWAKSVAAKTNEFFDQAGKDPTEFRNIMDLASNMVTEMKGIIVAMTFVIPVLKAMICGVSPENQLFYMFVNSDPSESEEVLGYPYSDSYQLSPSWYSRHRRIFETYLVPYYYKSRFEKFGSDVAHMMSGPSETHKWRQSIACEDPDAFRNDPPVKAIPLHYFTSFFRVFFYITIFSFFLNLFQIIFCKRKLKKRQRRLNWRGNRQASQLYRYY